MSKTPTEPGMPASARTRSIGVSAGAGALRVGDIVDYSPVVGSPPTRLGLTVAAAPERVDRDHWAVKLDGIVGAVYVLSLSLVRRAEDALIEDAHRALDALKAPKETDFSLPLTVAGRVRWLAMLRKDERRHLSSPSDARPELAPPSPPPDFSALIDRAIALKKQACARGLLPQAVASLILTVDLGARIDELGACIGDLEQAVRLL